MTHHGLSLEVGTTACKLESGIILICLTLFAAGCHRVSEERSEREDRAPDPSSTPLIAPQAPRNDDKSPDPDQNKTSPRSPNVSPPANTIDDLFLFFPSKYPDGNWAPHRLQFEDIWMTVEDGTRIHGWYCPTSNPRAYLLYAHGNAGNISHRSHLLVQFQQSGITTLAFDYRGYGKSDGTPSKKGIISDARAARAELAKRAGIPVADVVLMGRSLGGAVVIQLAAELPARGLIVESTFSSLADVASHHYPYLSWLVNSNSLNSVDALPRYSGPLLQSHGDADRTIPFELGQKLFQSANQPKRFVTIFGGDHHSPQSAEYARAFDQFIDGLAR